MSEIKKEDLPKLEAIKENDSINLKEEKNPTISISIPSDESKNEDKNLELNEEDLNMLSNLLKNMLDNNLTELVKDFKFDIDEQTKLFITKIIDENREYFDKFEENINLIIKDNKVDSKDIPHIIELIQKLYEMIYKLKENKFNTVKCAELCGFIIKLTLYVLIESKKINIQHDKEAEFIEESNKLIDSCVILIKLTKVLKPET